MTFQSNARATFYWRSLDKRASVIALAVTFGISFAVISTPQSSVALAYVFLLVMVVLVAVVFYMTTSPQINLLGGPGRWYRLSEIWRPILFGLIVIFAAYVVLLGSFGFPFGPNSPAQNVRDVLLFAVWVGFVEEYMRWTWAQVLPYGLVSANVLWVLLHPEVAPVLNGQSWSPFFAVFALSFGFLETWIMWIYETPLRGGINRWFGPILAATIHAGYDALVIIWKVEIVVPSNGSTVFGPMSLPLPLLAALLVPTVLLPWAMKRVRRRARGPRVKSLAPTFTWRGRQRADPYTRVRRSGSASLGRSSSPKTTWSWVHAPTERL